MSGGADVYKFVLLQVGSSALQVAYREGIRAGSILHASAEVNRSMGAKRLIASINVELSGDDGHNPELVDAGDQIYKSSNKRRKSPSVEQPETVVALPNGCHVQLPPGTAAAFAESIIGGVTTSISVGPLLACALHNIFVNIISYELPDENASTAPASLRVAVAQAVVDALHTARHLQDGQKSDLILFEPVMRVVVVAPQSVIGAVVSDIGSRRRGTILEVAACDSSSHGSDNSSIESQIVAEVPIAHLIGYASSLRSMTGGRASFSASFLKYAAVDDDDAARVLGTT